MKKRIMLIVLFSIFIFFMGSVFAVENDTGISSDMKTTDSTSNSHNYYSDNGKEYSNRFQEKNINNKNLNNNYDETQDLDDNIRATTWYVNPTTGNDNNAGNTASTPFKTILKAITVSANGAISRMIFTDETLSENIQTTIITNIIGMSKSETKNTVLE